MKKLLSILLVLTLALSLVCSAGIAAYADDDATTPVTDGARPSDAPDDKLEAPPTDDNKPEDDGAKPEDDGTKPEDDGTKPEDDGTKPENDGTKPEDDDKQPADDDDQPSEPSTASTDSDKLLAAVQEVVPGATKAELKYTEVPAAQQDSIKAQAKEQLKDKLDGLEFGPFLDITLIATIEEGTKDVTETDTSVSVTITIPSNAQGKESYKILRIHGDSYDLLDVDVIGNEATFETTQFSTYVLLYKASAPTTGDQLQAPGTGDQPQAPGSGNQPQAPADNAPAGNTKSSAKSGGGASGEPGSPQTGYSTLTWAASAVVTLLGGVMAIVPKKRLG
jgi:hypothetical protein